MSTESRGAHGMYCEDCGTKFSDGMCPNCHEELFIATFQTQDFDEPWSDEFRDLVESQSEAVKEIRRVQDESRVTR